MRVLITILMSALTAVSIVSQAPTARALAAGPASASFVGFRAPAAKVPDEVQISDPAGDANYLPGQDQPTPVQPFPGADLLHVWFTHDRVSITAHIHTSAPPGDARVPLVLQVWTNMRDDWTNSRTEPANGRCQAWFASFNQYFLENRQGGFSDHCEGSGALIRGDLREATLADGSTISSVTVARGASPALRAGRILKRPVAVGRVPWSLGVYVYPADRTDLGRSYRLR